MRVASSGRVRVVVFGGGGASGERERGSEGEDMDALRSEGDTKGAQPIAGPALFASFMFMAMATVVVD